MEGSLSSLTYKGSITEAIFEAKKQKKLFVVYISGEAESTGLMSTTWADSKVVESLSKYCILLHVQEGTTDAANFSALYPQRSIPSITAIGYNGVQLWQTEGFASAEVLASSLEKAWLSLHIQETTANLLTTALASKNHEPSTSGASGVDHLQNEEGISRIGVPSGVVEDPVQSSDANPAVDADGLDEDDCKQIIVKVKTKERIAPSGDRNSSKAFSSSNSKSAEQSDSIIGTPQGGVVSAMEDVDASESSSGKNSCLKPRKTINHNPEDPNVSSPLNAVEASEDIQYRKTEAVDGREADGLGDSARMNAPVDVLLNIRLPDDISIQEKFSVACTLQMVKDCVDRQQESGMNSYDLAVPYPRKVFNEQDMSKSLLELGLFNRQALIVLPHQKPMGVHGGRSLTADRVNSATTAETYVGENGGYFSLIRRFLSYMNPFSYLGGNANSSSTGQESQSSIWEYSSNPTLGSNFAGTERSTSPYPSNRSASTGRNDSRGKKLTSSRYGSNIHTLRHDEDESGFNDRNPFWNGNSTQYGGSSDDK